MQQNGDEILNMNDWYTLPQALERLEANSGRSVDPSYPRMLASKGKVRMKVISDRVRLYWREDINNYVVEERGKKVARWQRQRSVELKRQRGSKGKPGRPRKGQPSSNDDKTEGERVLTLAV